MATAQLHFAILAWLLIAVHTLRDAEDIDSDDPAKDHRLNIVSKTVAETLWSVRVLKASNVTNTILNRGLEINDKPKPQQPQKPKREPGCLGFWPCSTPTAPPPPKWEIINTTQTPTTNLDILWAWLMALRKNGLVIQNFRSFEYWGEHRNKDPAGFAAALVSLKYAFKTGMDDHIPLQRDKRSNAVFPPNCTSVSLWTRLEDTREIPIFKNRGRDDVKIITRQHSFENQDAGIASQENVPEEAKSFFGGNVRHEGKSLCTINTKKGGQVYLDVGAPFCAGASGSIQHCLLSMEDTRRGQSPEGVVPCSELKVRETIVAIMTAVLVATGQHSLTECLAVAQAMGYFKAVPPILEDYEKAAGEFEIYLKTKLGVSVGEGKEQPLVAMMQGKVSK